MGKLINEFKITGIALKEFNLKLLSQRNIDPKNKRKYIWSKTKLMLRILNNF